MSARPSASQSLMKLVCIQRNVGRGTVATTEVMRLVDRQRVDVALIQEPRLRGGCPVGFPVSWNVVSAAPQEPRAMILTRKTVSGLVVHKQRDLVAMLVQDGNKKCLIISAYFEKDKHSRAHADRQAAESLTHLGSLLGKYSSTPVLIGGDLNARHPLWGDNVEDSRGTQVVDFLEASNLHCVNDPGSPPTFLRRDRASWIDVTVASSDLFGRILDWRVVDDGLEDHRSIQFSLVMGQHENSVETPRYCTKYGKWKKFRSGVTNELSQYQERFERCSTREEIEDAYASFEETLTRICRASFKVRNANAYHSTVNWWTAELTAEKKRMRAARRRFQRSTGMARESWYTQYSRLRAVYTKKVKETRRKAWLSYCGRATDSNPFSLPYRLARGKAVRPLQIGRIRNGTRTGESVEEALGILLDYLFPREVRPANTAQREVQAESSSLECGPDDPPFSSIELKAVINTLPNRKAPGPDGYSYEIIKVLHKCLPELLKAIYNKCLELGHFLRPWKQGDLVLFAKVGKEVEKPNAYRPICLLACLGKILEKLVANRFWHFVFSRKIFSESQYGFVPYCSTAHALDSLAKRCAENRANNDATILASLDVSNAFNSVWYPSVVSYLRRHAFPGNLIGLITRYFENREISITLAGSTIRRRTTRGCPQGSCLGPFFWNCVVDEVLHADLPAGASLQAYADDLLLVVSGRVRTEMLNKLAVSLNTVERWAARHKLQLDPAKSHAISLKGKSYSLNLSHTRVPGITMSSSLKYLGVTIDDQLKFEEHLRAIRAAIGRTCNSLRPMTSRTAGISPDTLRKYNGQVFKQILAYGATLWYEGHNNKFYERGVVPTLRPLLVLATRGYTTCPTEALQAIAGILPADLALIKAISDTRVLQLRSPVQLGGVELHPNQFEHRINRFAIHPNSWVAIEWSTLGDRVEASPMVVYTDGSKTDKGVGAAFCVMSENEVIASEQFKLDDKCSNNQAETYAILSAFRWLLKTGQAGPIDLVSDSQSVLLALSNPCNDWPLIADLKILHRSAERRGVEVRYFWTKGHRAITGNSKADCLAKEAAEMGQPANEVKWPHSWMKCSSKGYVHGLWRERWRTSTGAKTTHLFIESPSEKVWSNCSELTQLMTRHSQSPRYLFDRGLVSSPNCVCGADGTLEHFIRTCPETAPIRSRLSRCCTSFEEVPERLKDPRDAEVLKQLIQFLEVNIDRLCAEPVRGLS